MVLYLAYPGRSGRGVESTGYLIGRENLGGDIVIITGEGENELWTQTLL